MRRRRGHPGFLLAAGLLAQAALWGYWLSPGVWWQGIGAVSNVLYAAGVLYDTHNPVGDLAPVLAIVLAALLPSALDLSTLIALFAVFVLLHIYASEMPPARPRGRTRDSVSMWIKG